MAGYDPKFLGNGLPGFEIPLPTFGPKLDGDVLRRPGLSGEVWANYPHYSIAVNRVKRTPVVAALNINQSQFVSGLSSASWDIDTRVGEDFQLGGEYYSSTAEMANPWDRGHVAMRANAAWGSNELEAKKASDGTYFFTNSTLQHENFNRDEWVALETWVRELQHDRDDLVTSFSGPVWFHFPRSITPPGRPTAIIPSAFFKVICFVNREEKLETRAFLLTQDTNAMRDREGKKLYDFENYQVTIADIEGLTGLQFPAKVAAANPLLAAATATTKSRLKISHLPERIEISSPDEFVTPDEPRHLFKDDEVDVFIAAALVNPAGSDRGNEWVSILNLKGDAVDLTGWTVDAGESGKSFPLEQASPTGPVLGPGEAKRFSILPPVVLKNAEGVIRLFNAAGDRIDRVKYSNKQAAAQGRPVIFAYRDQ